jgi:abhydrolase domain-containing protein 14
MSSDSGSKYVTVNDIKFRIRPSTDLGRDASKPVVVLFHGFSFNLDVWSKTGTYHALEEHSVPYLGVDLPRGKETETRRKNLPLLSDYVPILESLFRESGIDPASKLIIVGPSMGGAFALSYALQKKDQILGLVLVAPSLSGVDSELLEDLDIPILLIWGEKDMVLPVENKGQELKQMLPRSKLLIVKGAHHPVYLDRSEEFHELFFDFIDELAT